MQVCGLEPSDEPVHHTLPPARLPGVLERWLTELLPRALDWSARRAAASLAPVPSASLVAATLTHLVRHKSGAGSDGGGWTKGEVAAAVARGVGAHMPPTTRRELASEIAK